MTPDIAEAVADCAVVVETLAIDYVECHNDPAAYAHNERIHKPNGITWQQWGEEQCAVLASDITVRCERLMTLVEPGRTA